MFPGKSQRIRQGAPVKHILEHPSCGSQAVIEDADRFEPQLPLSLQNLQHARPVLPGAKHHNWLTPQTGPHYRPFYAIPCDRRHQQKVQNPPKDQDTGDYVPGMRGKGKNQGY